MSGPVCCSDCNRWYSSSGTPICGICRVGRAIEQLPSDHRLTSSNYDLIHSILERALGEVSGWLSVPLGASPAAVEDRPAPETEEVPSPSDRSSREERHKLKRTDKDLERREEHREDKRQPPEPPKARRETGKRRAKSEEEVDYSRPSEASWKPFKRSKNKGQKHRDRGRAFREGRIAQTRGLDGTAKETSGSSRYPQVPEDDTSSWKPVQDWSPQIGQQVHLRGTYKGEPSECVGEVEGLVDDREGQWVKIALTGSPHEVLKYWRRSNTEEFYVNRKPLLKKLDLKFRGYSVFTSFERWTPP